MNRNQRARHKEARKSGGLTYSVCPSTGVISRNSHDGNKLTPRTIAQTMQPRLSKRPKVGGTK